LRDAGDKIQQYGSTGLAAVSQGKDWIGIEKEASYVARARLNEYTAVEA
jgi:hypothetical protein